MMRFVCHTVLSAQKAQRKYGVPASVLISIAMHEVGWDPTDLMEGEPLLPDCGCCISASVDNWFMDQARELAISKAYRGAMPLVHDVEAYVKKLSTLGFCCESDAEDILNRIQGYELQDCDLAGILPPGQFSRDTFEPIRDSTGLVQLRPALDLRVLAEMGNFCEIYELEKNAVASAGA